MGGWLSTKNVEEMLEAMANQGMVDDGIVERVRNHLDDEDVSYALDVLMESRRGGR